MLLSSLWIAYWQTFQHFSKDLFLLEMTIYNISLPVGNYQNALKKITVPVFPTLDY